MSSTNNNNIPGLDYQTKNDGLVMPLTGEGDPTNVSGYNYGQAVLWPIWLDGGHSIDTLVAYVNTAVGSSNFRMALYDTVSSTDHHPNSIIQQSGDISSATAGVKTYSFTADSFSGGLYWIGFLLTANTASPTFRALSAISATYSNNRGSLIGGRTTISAGDASNCIYNTNYAGSPLTAFPDPWNEDISKGTFAAPPALRVDI